MKTYREELAWAAGFFDREGCVSRKSGRNRSQKYPRLIISQRGSKVPEVLLKFNSVVGLGNIQGPYSRGKPHQNSYYQFRVFGFEKVQAVVAMLWPFLGSVKKAQASQVLLECR